MKTLQLQLPPGEIFFNRSTVPIKEKYKPISELAPAQMWE